MMKEPVINYGECEGYNMRVGEGQVKLYPYKRQGRWRGEAKTF